MAPVAPVVETQEQQLRAQQALPIPEKAVAAELVAAPHPQAVAPEVQALS
jgi:hypothetical protein